LLDSETDLANTWNVLLDVGGFCQSCLRADVSQVDPPVSWVPEAQQILSDCRAVAQDWLTARETIIPTIAGTFMDYCSLVSSTVAGLGSSQDPVAWTEGLGQMREATSAASAAVKQANAAMTDQQARFQLAYRRLDNALALARMTVSSEEADIDAVQVKLQALVDRLQSLGATFSSSDMSAGQSVVQTVATIVYEAAVEGEAAIPVLSVVAVLYSVSSSVYTVVSTDAEIAELLEEVSAAMKQLSGDARILAMARGLIASLGDVVKAYAEALQLMPRLNTYWDAETAKLDILTEALRHGTVAGLTEIEGLPVALTIWQQLAKVAGGMVLPLQTSDKDVPLAISLLQGSPTHS